MGSPAPLLGWAWQTLTPLGCSLGIVCPRGIWAGEKAAGGFPPSPRSPPGRHPPPSCPRPEPPREIGDIVAKLGRGGWSRPTAAPQKQSPSACPPSTSRGGGGGQTLAASPLTLARGRTMKAPPPPDSTMMATNLGLTAQKELSHVTLETRMSSYIWSAFTGCPKTCRNLLWRTTRRLMAGGCRVRLRPPPCYSMEGFWPPSGLALRDTPPYPGHSGRPGDTEMMRDAGWCPMWSRPRGRDRG